MPIGERLSWIVANLNEVLDIGLLVGSFLPLLIAATIVHHHRRSR